MTLRLLVRPSLHKVKLVGTSLRYAPPPTTGTLLGIPIDLIGDFTNREEYLAEVMVEAICRGEPIHLAAEKELHRKPTFREEPFSASH